MISIKWFDVALAVQPSQFLRLLRKHSFARGMICGIDLTFAQDATIAGRFIEEVRQSTTYTSPLGEEITNHIISHKIIDFAFFHRAGNQWYLRIDGTPRSLKTFTRFISELTSFGFAISTISTPVLGVLQFMHSRGTRTIHVSNLLAANLPLGKGGLGKVDIRAPNGGDALEAFRKNFPKAEHSIERVSATVEIDTIPVVLAISKSGALSFNEEHEDLLVREYIAYLNEQPSLRLSSHV